MKLTLGTFIGFFVMLPIIVLYWLSTGLQVAGGFIHEVVLEAEWPKKLIALEEKIAEWSKK